jgi:hypothetical protein
MRHLALMPQRGAADGFSVGSAWSTRNQPIVHERTRRPLRSSQPTAPACASRKRLSGRGQGAGDLFETRVIYSAA